MPSNGAQMDFFVQESNAWWSLRSERRRSATERFVALAEEMPPATLAGHSKPERFKTAGLPGFFFALFFVSSGYLWLERRRAM
jgi:hypothetical protein